ncbi:retrovirus-related pol polyprotein from transposon TNT 1-94 [Tanacetum coccineum]
MSNVPYVLAVGSIMYAVRCNMKRELRVSCYIDAGYLTDADDLKSQTGYVFVLNGDAEYIAAFDASKEVVWIRKFISGLNVVPTIEEPITMYYDNTGAIAIANNHGVTKGARHFRTKVHYLQETIELGNVRIEKVDTDDNLADPFTKALAFSKHSELTRMKRMECAFVLKNDGLFDSREVKTAILTYGGKWLCAVSKSQGLNPPPLYRISPTNIFWDLTMAASSSFHDSLFSMNTLLHMITIKLSSTNYLLWRNHMIPIFTYQKLIGHINGTSISPSPKVTIEGKANPNPDLLTWTEDDQRAVILLQSSLTEEAAAEVLGLTTAHQIWLSLEAAYSNASVERIHLLRDSLRQLKKGTSSVSDYCRRFKALCNQLSAIGHPVVEIDKLHWFLCGLGPSYETFSTAIRATKPAPMFRDLVTQAESHELFLQSLHGTPTPPAVFHVETTNTDSAQGGGRSNRGNHSRGRGRGHNRRPPHCQLCLTNGHYATTCPSLYTYATQASPSSDESLAKAFHAQCHVNTNTPNWHVDSGATDHMTPACDSLHHSSPYPGNAKVMFGNGKTLPITHTGSTTVSHDIPLRNVLVIPKLNKKLLSVSKLTTDHPVDVLFSQPFFYIHDRKTKRVLARGRCEHGLYVLKDEPTAFIATAKVIKPASYELWHARLGHVSFDVISTLNKLGVLSITSLLPKPILCTPCQLAKGQRLPFTINAKRSSHPLDLIHCDLWGPAPICSKDGYRYYVAFIDDYSRFTWLYPLKTKTGFYSVLPVFINLVQTQCSRKIKTFQSDGGTEFVNQIVRKIFEDNGTFHRFSCPYTPQQNGRAERKHRHIVETGLAMLFNAHVPASYWVDAFTTATFIINRLPTPLLKNKSPFEL